MGKWGSSLWLSCLMPNDFSVHCVGWLLTPRVLGAVISGNRYL